MYYSQGGSTTIFSTRVITVNAHVVIQSINQSINQFNSGDVAHTRTREIDEQIEAADRKNSTTHKKTY